MPNITRLFHVIGLAEYYFEQASARSEKRMMMQTKYDVVIIGGGLAGIMAALRLTRERKNVALLDNSLPEAGGQLGGFAKFSGAKFSLPPAGLGLLPLVGTMENLSQKIDEVISELALDGYNSHISLDHAALLIRPTNMFKRRT